MARRRHQPHAERRIYFYRMDAGLDDEGRPLPPPAMDDLLTELDALPHSVNGGRYLPREDGVLTAWVDSARSPYKLRFGHSRRSALPQMERDGRLSPLPIAAHAGLAESVHAIFFPDGIVGSDFNFYGPRLTMFGRYLAAVLPDAERFELHPLMRRDAVQALDALGQATFVQLRVHPHFVETTRQADESIHAALEAQQNLGDPKWVEIAWRRRGRLQDTVDRLLTSLRRLARRDDLRDGALKFIVSGVHAETGRIATVDLLRDQLISTKRILRQSERNRALRAESAYMAIDEAHEELRPHLRRASAVMMAR